MAPAFARTLGGAAATGLNPGMATDDQRHFLYVGGGSPTGDIQVFALDLATGALDLRSTTSSGSSTSFCALHPSRRFLYTTQNRTDRLSAFSIDPQSAGLGLLNQVAVTGVEGATAAGPTYVEVDRAGGFLLAANYRGHNLVVHRLEPDGRIGALVHSRSDGLHAHSIRLDPANRTAFAPYLGSDIIAQLAFDAATGALTPRSPPAVATAAKAGPRHLDFHPDGRFVYVVNELDATVNAYAFDAAAGTLGELQSLSAVPATYTGRRWSSDVHVAPSGRFVYVANRAHDSLAVFAADPGSGRLTLCGHHGVQGATPRAFTLTPDGRFLFVANQDSASVGIFAVDGATGSLAPLRALAVAPSPYFVRVVSLPALQR
jgi:6-phosphogluconolactonase